MRAFDQRDEGTNLADIIYVAMVRRLLAVEHVKLRRWRNVSRVSCCFDIVGTAAANHDDGPDLQRRMLGMLVNT